MGDQQIDDSVRTRFRKMRISLQETTYKLDGELRATRRTLLTPITLNYNSA